MKPPPGRTGAPSEDLEQLAELLAEDYREIAEVLSGGWTISDRYSTERTEVRIRGAPLRRN